MSHKVRIKKFPHKEFEVGEKEYIDLKRQGLLADEPAVVEEKTRRAPAPSAVKEEN